MALPYTRGQSASGCVEEHDPLAEQLDGHAGRLLRAPQPARARVRGNRAGRADRLRPARRRRPAGGALRHGAGPEDAAAARDGDRRRAVLRRRRAVLSRPPPRSPGRRRRGSTSVVCGIGPGIVGTDSDLGHGGLAVAEAANAAAALGGPRDRGRALLGRRPAGAPPWSLPSHARGAPTHPRRTRGRVARRPRSRRVARCTPSRSTSRAGKTPARASRSRHMGRGAVRRPVVLCDRVRRRPSRANADSVMEERRLGPVVGLGTYETFLDDAGRAAEVVGAALGAGSTRLRLVADVRRRRGVARIGARRTARRRRSWRRRSGPTRSTREGTVRGPAAMVREGRDPAGAQPRRLARAPAAGSRKSAMQVASTGSASRTGMRGGVRARARGGAPDRPIRHGPDPAQPSRAGV